MNVKNEKLVSQYMAWCRKRKSAMQALRDKEWSFARIGDRYGVTRQRVQQILKEKT